MRSISILTCAALFTAVFPMRAEDQVRTIQEELRRRNVFFGDVDGRRTEEYSEAVRRYQKRKGLAASGQDDRDTLRSLGLLPRSPDEPPPKELSWPDEPVLKSDAHLDVAAAAKDLGAETGVDPATVAVEVTKKSSKQSSARGRTAARGSRAEEVHAVEKPSRSSQSQRLSFRNAASIPAGISDFVHNYLRAVGRNQIKDELHFYADRINYFGSHQVDRRIVEQTLRKYYQRWPQRSYALTGPVSYSVDPYRGEIVMKYRIAFTQKNGDRKVKGQTDNRLTINAATADPRIVAIEEVRVRRL